jgi:hypothetical protein
MSAVVFQLNEGNIWFPERSLWGNVTIWRRGIWGNYVPPINWKTIDDLRTVILPESSGYMRGIWGNYVPQI